MCKRKCCGLLTNFVPYFNLIPSLHTSTIHWHRSPAPLDFLHFFHPIGPGPLPHWIFSRLVGLPTNKVHLPQWPPNYTTFLLKNRFHLNDIPQMISLPLALDGGSQGRGGGLQLIMNYWIKPLWIDTNYFI
jgi:hypothetical protein